MHNFTAISIDWVEDGDSPGGTTALFHDAEDEWVTKSSDVSWIQVRQNNLSQTMNSIYDGQATHCCLVKTSMLDLPGPSLILRQAIASLFILLKEGW